MKKLIGYTTVFLVVSFFVGSLVAIPATAVPLWGTSVDEADFSGSRSTLDNDGIYTPDGNLWDDGAFSIEWEVTYDDLTEYWTYKYWITAPDNGDLSHWILEVTQDDQPFNIYDGTSPNEGPRVWESSGGQILPEEIYGVKFDFGTAGVGTQEYIFVTDRDPVWGVFWAKDGKNETLVAYSTALLDSSFQTSETLAKIDFIVRPDGGGPVIPEPSTILLVGLGLLGLAGFRKNLRK